MTGIYTRSIECMGGPNLKERFLRVIEVETDTTLADLHDHILELTGFDGSDHLSDSYLANNWYGGEKSGSRWPKTATKARRMDSGKHRFLTCFHSRGT